MRRRIAAVIAALIACVVIVATTQAFDNPGSPVPGSVATLKPQMVTDSRAMLNYLKDKATPTDPQYYELGTWHYSTEASCPTCGLGPASLAAALYIVDGKKAADLALAVETLDKQIQTNARADGQIGVPGSTDTMFAGSEIGFLCWTLRASLDAAHIASCASVLSKASDWLVSSGNSTWYINGNINALELETFAFTWLLTGNPKYRDQYETELKFLVSPPQGGQANGFGLQYSAPPHRPDGIDGSAFLGERNGGNPPGYDADYADWQQSILGRTYGVNRDARLLRITNMMFNQEWQRTNHSTFVLDATGGTRHNTFKPLYNGSLATMGWTGGREDVVALLADQWRLAVVPTFVNNARDNLAQQPVYRGYGSEVAQILMATTEDRLR